MTIRIFLIVSVLAVGSAFCGSALHAEEKAEKVTPPVNKWIQHYHNRVEEFRNENEGLPKDRKNIVFVGDSLTEAFPLSGLFPGKSVLNRGIIADGIGIRTDRGVLGRMDECVFDCSPEIVFLLIGVNDLPYENLPPKKCAEGVKQIIEQTLTKLPNVRLVMHTALPTGQKYKKHDYLNPRIIEFNKHLVEIAEAKGLPIIDLYPLYKDDQGLLRSEMTNDGLHIKKEYYKLWADKARPFIDTCAE